MVLYARKLFNLIDEDIFSYDKYPNIPFWIAQGQEYCSGSYLTAENYAEEVYTAFQEYVNTDSETAEQSILKYIDSHCPNLQHKPYTETEKKAWSNAIKAFSSREINERSYICSILILITGQKHRSKVLRGPIENKTLTIIYPVDCYDAQSLKYLYAEYFHTGSSWILHATDSCPSCEDDIEGFFVYCHSCNLEEVTRELAEYMGDEGYTEVTAHLFSENKEHIIELKAEN